MIKIFLFFSSHFLTKFISRFSLKFKFIPFAYFLRKLLVIFLIKFNISRSQKQQNSSKQKFSFNVNLVHAREQRRNSFTKARFKCLTFLSTLFYLFKSSSFSLISYLIHPHLLALFRSNMYLRHVMSSWATWALKFLLNFTFASCIGINRIKV